MKRGRFAAAPPAMSDPKSRLAVATGAAVQADPPARLAGHALVEALIAQGVDTVFGVPGDGTYQLCFVIR